MVESIIKYSDLIKDDGGFLKLEKDLEELDKSIKSKTKDWKDSLSIVDVTDSKRIQELEGEISKLQKSYQLLKTQKEKLNTTKKKAEELSKQELIALQKERAEQAKNRNEAKLIAQIKNSQKGSIEQLRAKLGLVTIAWAKLSEEERNNSERGERLIQSKLEITEQLKREEKATGDARRNVGNYSEAVKEAIREMREQKEVLELKNRELRDEQNLLEESSAEYRVYQKEIDKTEKEINSLNNELNEGEVAQNKMSKSVDKTTGYFTKMLLAVGGWQVLRNGFNLISEFETQIADLSAVTGQTGKDLDFLKDKSIDFSKKFGVSASSIAEAFKLAGSARPELLKNGQAMADLTEKAIILSKASGDDVPTSIANLTGTLNAFDLPATKAGEVMDTLANASQLGAVEIPYLTEAFTKFGSVASTAGVGISESASALEILGEKIPEASIAGTNMKNILIKLQVEANKQGRSFQGLSKELTMLKPRLKDVTFLSKMFGSENINGAQILIKNSEKIKELSEQYGKQGTAMDMYLTKSKTVGEATNRLKESFNAYFLELVNGQGGAGMLASSLDFIGKNINTIIGLVGKAVIAFISFQTIMRVMALRDLVNMNGGLGKTISGMFSFKRSTDVATESQKNFSNALKGIGWTALIMIGIEVVKMLYDIASGADLARDKMARLNKVSDQAVKSTEKNVANIYKQQELRIAELDRQLKKRNITQQEYNRLVLLEKQSTLESLKASKIKTNNRKQEYKEARQELADLKKQFEKAKSVGDTDMQSKLLLQMGEKANEIAKKYKIKGDKLYGVFDLGMSGDPDKVMNQLDAFILGANKSLIAYSTEIGNSTEATKDASTEIEAYSGSIDDNTKKVKKNTTELKANNTDLKHKLQLQKEISQIEYEISQFQNQIQQEDVSKKYDKELEAKMKQAREFGNADLSNLNTLIEQEADLKMKAEGDLYNSKLNALKQSLVDEKDLLIQDLNEKRDTLLKQEGLTGAERFKINQSYNEQLKEIDKVMLNETEVFNKKKEQLDIEYKDNYDKIQEEKKEKTTETNKQILESQKDYIDKVRQLESEQFEEKFILLDKSIEEQQKILEKSTGIQRKIELEALRRLMNERYQLRKTEIENEYDYMLSKVEKGSIEEELITKQKNNALLKLENDHKKEVEDIDKSILENKKEMWKEMLDKFKQILSQILDKVIENAQNEVKVSEDKINKQEKQVDIQRERAQLGLSNTLAYEEKELAKAEARKIKAEKKLERAQQVKALYASYTQNASSGKGDALAKTLKDFAMLKAISLSFGDGGIVEDKLPSNGIFQGQSHQGNAGGIPILVEGKEGIFSVKEMSNLGKDNFYALKSLAGKGRIEEGFFNGETKAFIQAVPMVDNGLKNEVIEMKKAILQMPSQEFKIVNYTKDLFKIIETVKTGNSTNRNIYEVKKPRL